MGATVHLGRGPLLLGCAQLLRASDLVQQARDGGLSGFVTVNQQLRDPGSSGISALNVQEFIHVNLQFWDLFFLAVVEVSELFQDPLLQVEAPP